MARKQLWKGLVAGGAAGLAGTIAMTQFQHLWSKASEKLNDKSTMPGDSGTRSNESDSEDATMKAAGKLAALARHNLSREEKKKASPIIHFAFGTGMGSLYGALVEYGPRDMRKHSVLSGLGLGVGSLPEPMRLWSLLLVFPAAQAKVRCLLTCTRWLRTLCMALQQERCARRSEQHYKILFRPGTRLGSEPRQRWSNLRDANRTTVF
jgi:hypothetical protein